MKVQIYGDSIMKAVIVDENFKYRPLAKGLLAELEEKTGVQAVNRAHFGYTSEKGQAVLRRDLEKGLDCQAALLEFGGFTLEFIQSPTPVPMGEGNIPHIAVYVKDVDSATADMYNLPMGVYVQDIIEGSAAEKAGIKAKDIITELGGYKIENMNDLTRALRNFEGGQTATVTVWRGGVEKILTITFDEKTSE